MNTIYLLHDEIEKVTLEIESNYPELHALLDETPNKTNIWSKIITAADLEDYLNSLKAQLKTFQHDKSL